MLQVGDVARGPLWPEIVEIKKCESIQGSFYRIEAFGKDTSKYYQAIILPEQISAIEVLNQPNESGTVSAEEIWSYLLYRELLIDQKFSKSRVLGNKNHPFTAPNRGGLWQNAASPDRSLLACRRPRCRKNHHGWNAHS